MPKKVHHVLAPHPVQVSSVALAQQNSFTPGIIPSLSSPVPAPAPPKQRRRRHVRARCKPRWCLLDPFCPRPRRFVSVFFVVVASILSPSLRAPSGGTCLSGPLPSKVIWVPKVYDRASNLSQWYQPRRLLVSSRTSPAVLPKGFRLVARRACGSPPRARTPVHIHPVVDRRHGQGQGFHGSVWTKPCRRSLRGASRDRGEAVAKSACVSAARLGTLSSQDCVDTDVVHRAERPRAAGTCRHAW